MNKKIKLLSNFFCRTIKKNSFFNILSFKKLEIHETEKAIECWFYCGFEMPNYCPSLVFYGEDED